MPANSSYPVRQQAAARVAPRSAGMSEAQEVRQGEKDNRFGPKPEAPRHEGSPQVDRNRVQSSRNGVYRGGWRPGAIPNVRVQPGAQRA